MLTTTNYEDPTQLKQYIVVVKRPWWQFWKRNMSPGKIASQVTHATFCALDAQRKDLGTKRMLHDWKENGMCVIVLQCRNETELLGMSEYFKQWKVPHHLYIDEGMTEVRMGTPTALATGVLPPAYHWMLSTMRLY